MKSKPSLADYIYSDVAASLAENGEPPCRLTLSSIASHYGVSLSPVRTAVERLVSDKLLKTFDNGRLAIGSRKSLPKAAAFKNVAPPVNHEKVIQADVIRRSLLGEEGFLRENWSAERYGIGRTALRPILSRLAGQGLIERVPRRGWKIRPFDKDDLCAFISIRELLELEALRLARPTLKKDRLQELLKANQTADLMSPQSLDNNLHQYWISNCGNPYIKRFFSLEAVYYRTLFDYAAPEASVVEQMADQHCRVLEALINDNFRVAKDALKEHIQAQKPITQALIDQLQESHNAAKESA
ncbi:HTH-type transcriptional repressor CsiR [Posidoniimonas polymericola]|uniref:HTH-type transcriptional repressor CsiR n=1 Tax=Posidoniimonas polymericola TaxID=2528002 RepID=A0A5C5YLB5_9BACT|nr:GntR family transcriptional regulator [Posidoniimonas polymericola]TWT75715.1 HTH-type transcriptional repressor CsiR [Posidoniimonas polymericola]